MGKGSFSGAGGAGWLCRSGGRIALGCQRIVIDDVGRRLDKEKNTSPRLVACKAVAGGVGREGAGLIKDEDSRMRLVDSDVVFVF
jgi:hypothetical protein